MPSNHLILCHPLILLPYIFPSIRVFSNESVLHIRWPSIGVSASTSVLPMNIQDLFHLGLTGLISLQSKGLSRVFSNTTVQRHWFFSTQLSLWSNSHIHKWQLELTEVGTFMFYSQKVSAIDTVLSAVVIILYYTLNNQTYLITESLYCTFYQPLQISATHQIMATYFLLSASMHLIDWLIDISDRYIDLCNIIWYRQI